MSLKFVNDDTTTAIRHINDNTCNSDIEASSSSDIDIDRHSNNPVTDSDDNFDSDDEELLCNLIPLSSNVPLKKSKKVKNSCSSSNKVQYQWDSINAETNDLQDGTVYADDDVPALNGDKVQCDTPLNYFKMFFDDRMIEHICTQTNLYSVQCNISKGAIGVNINELERYLGILLTMSVVSAPYYRFYWEIKTRYEPIASTMSRDRFDCIKQYLHFNDNTTDKKRDDETRDRLFKVRPLFEMLRQNCISQEPEEHNSIDEQMIPFKGRSFLRRYMPKKPHKWGFKIFSRNGLSGTLYDFDLDGAPDPNKVEIIDKIGYCGADIVLSLCYHLPKYKNFKLYFDNYFTYLELLIRLRKEGFWAVGTLRQDRMRGCKLKSEKELKKLGRGSYDGAIDTDLGIVIVRWFDNKAVQLASNYVSIDPADEVQRWSKSVASLISVTRPHIVKVYNSAMGGVDLFDMFQALYRLDHKSRKWYIRIFYWIIASSVVNAWLRYRKDFNAIKLSKGNQSFLKKEKQMSLVEFTLNVAASLMKNAKPIKKRTPGRPSTSSSVVEQEPSTSKRPRKAPDLIGTPEDIRFDNYKHWPTHREDRPRCFVCREKTRWGCSKCEKGLCLTKERNCFVIFHDISYNP